MRAAFIMCLIKNKIHEKCPCICQSEFMWRLQPVKCKPISLWLISPRPHKKGPYYEVINWEYGRCWAQYAIVSNDYTCEMPYEKKCTRFAAIMAFGNSGFVIYAWNILLFNNALFFVMIWLSFKLYRWIKSQKQLPLLFLYWAKILIKKRILRSTSFQRHETTA